MKQQESPQTPVRQCSKPASHSSPKPSSPPPSKLDVIRAAHAAGYVITLHVVLIPEDLAVERVAHRVRHGGHDVPEGKIRERHRRLWSLVADAIKIADTTKVYDNSQAAGPRVIAQMTEGNITGAPAWPAWAPSELTRRWPRHQDFCR